MSIFDAELNLVSANSGPLDETVLIERLREVVGYRHVLTGAGTKHFTTGYRYGSGAALAVVQPANLIEQWRILKIAVAADLIVIMQSANTGLTGGSTPFGEYDRPVLLVNTLRIRGLHLIAGGEQVICLPGTTLFDLERALRPIGREPHSVIGSSCVGASVFGGVCNNSGGSLVRRGPAYTEMALFARVDGQGDISLINHLGVRLGNDPEEILRRVENGDFDSDDVDLSTGRAGSDLNYDACVRDVEAATPARYNADPSRLCEASGSAGKVMLMAVRLDTFAKPSGQVTFYIGTNDPADLTALRRTALAQFGTLPISGEYIHRDAFDIAARYGKDTFLAIQHLGTDRMPKLFALKSRIDTFMDRLSLGRLAISDRILQFISRLFPEHLPDRMRAYRDRFEHHLLLKTDEAGADETRAYLDTVFAEGNGAYFECSPEEAEKAFLHRFAVAGAAVRYRAVHPSETEDIIALDFALRRDDRDWQVMLPQGVESEIAQSLYYGHFFCHVFHHDYISKSGADTEALKSKILAVLDKREAEYPAEHNVGHLYAAKPALSDHYRDLDPTNLFNPGIGHTSRNANWR